MSKSAIKELLFTTGSAVLITIWQCSTEETYLTTRSLEKLDKPSTVNTAKPESTAYDPLTKEEIEKMSYRLDIDVPCLLDDKPMESCIREIPPSKLIP